MSNQHFREQTIAEVRKHTFINFIFFSILNNSIEWTNRLQINEKNSIVYDKPIILSKNNFIFFNLKNHNFSEKIIHFDFMQKKKIIKFV